MEKHLEKKRWGGWQVSIHEAALGVGRRRVFTGGMLVVPAEMPLY